jgi:hypothetical protein
MPVESTATGIWDIDTNYPDGTTETVSLLDNYMRARWEKVLVTFPNIGGVVTASHTELNHVDGVTSAIQTQLDAKLAASTYTAADVLTKVKTVDGTGSGLDADLLDGNEAAAFALQTDIIDMLTSHAPTYESAEAEFDVSGTAVTATHSLGSKPSKWAVVAICKTATFGYSVGDEIELTAQCTTSVGSYATWANATEVGFEYGVAIPFYNRALNVIGTLDTANWRLIFRAWL